VALTALTIAASLEALLDHASNSQRAIPPMFSNWHEI
jgi:hypothetical protein